MKKLLLLASIAITLLSSCQSDTVYTDQNGRHYKLKDVCVKSHIETGIMYLPDGNGGQTMYPTTEMVCDSSQLHIIYLDK